MWVSAIFSYSVRIRLSIVKNVHASLVVMLVSLHYGYRAATCSLAYARPLQIASSFPLSWSPQSLRMRILTYPASAIQFRIWTASRPWTCTPRREPRSYRSSWSRAVLPGTILLKTPQGQGRRSMTYGSRGVGSRAVSKTRSNGVNSTLDSTIWRIMVALARSRCLVAVVWIITMSRLLHSYALDPFT